MTMIREERPSKGSFDYLLEPLRDDVWNEPPVRDYAPATPPPPPKREVWAKPATPEPPVKDPPHPPRVVVNIEINQRSVPARKNQQGRWLAAALVWGVIAFILMAAVAHSEERWTSYRQGFMTFHRGDDGSSAQSYKQGFTTYTDMQLPDGSSSHCRTWKQGWQTFTECN